MIGRRWARRVLLLPQLVRRRWQRRPLGDIPPTWPPSRHPFQVLMMAGAVWSGVFGMLGAGTPPSLARTLDRPLLLTWYGALVVCGALAVAAAVTATRDPLWAMLLERLSLFVVGPMALVYSVVLSAVTGPAGVVAAAWAAGFGLACIVRGGQVQQSLSWLRWNRIHEEALAP